MRFTDRTPSPRGMFALQVYRRGVLVERFEDHNLIVNRGRTNVVYLLGAGGTSLVIASIGFGTNGAPASPNDTALQGAFVKPLDSVSYPDAYSVQFNFSLGNNDANGLQIQEFGLLTQSGLLHARKVRGGVLIKESDLSLTGTWTLNY